MEGVTRLLGLMLAAEGTRGLDVFALEDVLLTACTRLKGERPCLLSAPWHLLSGLLSWHQWWRSGQAAPATARNTGCSHPAALACCQPAVLAC